jgi:hypothetical protein
MVKRFNNLDAALKYLRPTGAGEGTVIPDAPTGTPLKKYQDYKAGKVNLDYPRAAASLPGEINIIAIKPFALPSADTTTIRTTLSNRAQGQFSTFGLTDAELGLDLTLQDTDKEVAGFIPAKAICRNITGTTASTRTSKLTGLPYKSKADASYTFPIGRTTTNPTWGQQKAFVIAQVSASSGNKSVSFKSEKY